MGKPQVAGDDVNRELAETAVLLLFVGGLIGVALALYQVTRGDLALAASFGGTAVACFAVMGFSLRRSFVADADAAVPVT